MKLYSALAGFGTFLALATVVRADSAGPVFYGDPPDEHHPWAVHDGNRSQPKIVTPGTFTSQDQPGKPPSDAIVLFDGSDISNWVSEKDGSPAKWQVQDGLMVVVPKTGDIQTKQQFGDCQLHIEWAEPPDVQGSSQGRGNSGVFLEGRMEIQVLDSYDNITYADGSAASVYGVNPPLVNALRPPGEFQVYDIIFRRPVYQNGHPVDAGYVTVLVNGVLAQDHTPLEGPGGHMGRSHAGPFPEKGPLRLQDHGNPVRFRNIWYRPLPPRSVEGGTDGWLSTAATLAKRKQIAADIRQDAARLKNDANPLPEILRLAESLEYENDKETMEQVEAMAKAYVQSVAQLPPEQMAASKDAVKHLNQVFDYLVRWRILPADFPPKAQAVALIKEQRWDKK
jgi:hypothetical protein